MKDQNHATTELSTHLTKQLILGVTKSLLKLVPERKDKQDILFSLFEMRQDSPED